MLDELRLITHVGRLAIRGNRAQWANDYNEAGPTYDEGFSIQTGRHGIELVSKLKLPSGARVLDLGCGTGQLALHAARQVGGNGSILAVDTSAGMLAQARKTAAAAQAELGDTRIEFREADMAAVLAQVEPGTIDAAIIGWSICYTRPVRLLREVRKAVKPGGQVAVIETRKDALKEVDAAFRDVLTQDPRRMQRYMALTLPGSARTMRRWLLAARLRPEQVWEGAQALPARTPHETVEWMRTSGAEPGFRDALDQAHRSEIDAAVERRLAERYGPTIALRHTFVAAIASRP